MSLQRADHDRLFDLLAARATEGLSDQAQRDLEAELSRAGVSEIDMLDEASAALDVALFGAEEAMPPGLQSKVQSAGIAWISEQQRVQDRGPLKFSQKQATVSMGVGGWLGWLAAAAAIAFAVLANLPTRPATPEERRAALLSVADVRQAGWVSLPDSPLAAPAAHKYDRGISGDVVWSDARDEGYMRISGLAPNDPTQYEYQLWIFDAARPVGDLPQFRVEGLPELLTQRPVDGGVFDVATSGEVVIPIHAKLPVGKAVIFAVTVEPPGGSVVSQRDVVFLTILPG
ncbi:MAG: anti-sigma factor [Phycisphaerales bacterium]|nr:anti-sigma factor [Phycisphaerales bacterium]